MCHFLLKRAKSFLTQQHAKPVGVPAQPYSMAEPEPEVPTVALPSVEAPGLVPSLGQTCRAYSRAEHLIAYATIS